MSEPRERPILFNGEMVRAILDGRKTQTRRVVNPQPILEGGFWKLYAAEWSEGMTSVPAVPGHSLATRNPYGHPGDVLWVRETWAPVSELCADPSDGAIYRATYSGRIQPERWRPSIHMPRWAARIFLRVTGVRVERLQDIPPNDCIAEGAWRIEDRELGRGHEAIAVFQTLWDSINAGRGYGWDVNPWVWVIEFERINAAREAGMKEA